MSDEAVFQRARSAEQVQARQTAILNAARDLLTTSSVADVSLRQIAAVVGLSKSNVVRYFPTREAIFLTLLLEDYVVAVDALEESLGAAQISQVVVADDRQVIEHLTTEIASVFGARPRLCELIAASQAVLERNVPTAEAATFKRGLLAGLERLAALISAQLPHLTALTAFEAAGMSWVVIAGTWPMTRLTPAVDMALNDPELALLRVDFTRLVSRTLQAALTGLQHLPPPAEAPDAGRGPF